MKVTFYQVGGSVRDEILGVKSKDIDYAVEVLGVAGTVNPYDVMYEAVKMRGGEIFLAKPEYLTLRAKVALGGAEALPCDFVLCRKDGSYYDGRHPETVEPGTILDDLARRDFTCNAIAKAEDGTLIDPHGGVADLKVRYLRCVGSPEQRFTEDGLRMLRAIRFAITKRLALDKSISTLLDWPEFFGPRLIGVSHERIREELHKCFQSSTVLTLDWLSRHKDFFRYMFLSEKLWLKPTLEAR